MENVMQNTVAEINIFTEKHYQDPFEEIKVTAQIERPDGNVMSVPGFWRGGNCWTIRYSSSYVGMHRYIIHCSDTSNKDIHGKTGEINIIRYKGANPLYKHGGIAISFNKKHFVHEDGKPFFWLGDTWWMSLTKRLCWPEGFEELVRDRVGKGYNVIQLIAGLYPDMEPFDERGANEAGLAWDRDFKTINPGFFELADLKIKALAESGLVTCIVACWGFFLEYAGKNIIEKHWEYLIARYGAFPVVWCAAGEALMDFYKKLDTRESYSLSEKQMIWSGICRYIRKKDPFKRLVTIHPIDYGHKMVDDDEVLDFEMLQTGHGSYNSLIPTVQIVKKAVGRGRFPVINSEVCYEGICGTNFEDIQRFVFWASVLNGTSGHTYGANGIWQLNSRETPYGPSPHGATWGDTPWEEAYKLPGSFQIGLGKKLLEKYEWWKFEVHPDWVDNPGDESKSGYYAAGIEFHTRIIFIPFLSGFGWGEITVRKLEKDVVYKAYYFDPITGEEYGLGNAVGDSEDMWKSGRFTKFQDWILVMEAIE